jgi:hypothetical protein
MYFLFSLVAAYMNKFTSQPLPPPQTSAPSFASYNYHSTSKKIDIPNGRVFLSLSLFLFLSLSIKGNYTVAGKDL